MNSISKPTQWTPMSTKTSFRAAQIIPGEACREHFRAFLGPPQYLVTDPATLETAIIDPVLDYDDATSTTSTTTADCILEFIEQRGLKVTRILETHAHADHLTASQYLKSRLPESPIICIGKRITQVQATFGPKYGLDPASLVEEFDVLLEDDEEFMLGQLSCKVIHLPGHTPDSVGYLVGKSVFAGDSIFLPDVGSARADFPGGNAKDLYASMKRLLSLPQDYCIFVGHDYPPSPDRRPTCMSTVDEQAHFNKHIKTGTSKDVFVQMREARDATLGEPKLLHSSLHTNIRAGKISSDAGRGAAGV
ncbi:hypothetical protein H0H81_005323 [Sphagnurus paluster]|uniref:Metallo-beta-lactamase domain-containing protein n=1 Tax=Sphagnurus paluster TaxID=117069 RepID=A0A9P7KH85_9AGAR|nr:hypothetical protein H0H81_005323 [Sphagnurus paluster]